MPALPPSPTPKMMIAAPIRIIAMIATTLMIANQNSNSPKALTAIRLTAGQHEEDHRGDPRGTLGSQYLT